MGYLVRGLRLWVTSPRLMLLGALPALVVGLFFAAALVLFAINLESLATWITPFADRWDDPLRAGTRIAAGTALGAVTVLLAMYTFVAVTLTLGNPFYERIWRAVEQRMGDAPVEIDEPFWRSATRDIGSGIRLFALTATVGLSLFIVGFIPVVGQTAVPVLGALLGGWFLTLELTGFAFDARGLRLRERRRMLGARRASTLGFGVLTYVLFLVPLGAVVIMPAAVAGATMLSRDALASTSRSSLAAG